ncbi:MAG: hypothetical protein H7288_11955 [Kineosporiaceae bacterium]|nr:hypothetical protein [Aeromicrobium sp.]
MDHTVRQLVKMVEHGEMTAEGARPIFRQVVARPKKDAFPKNTPEWCEDNDGWGADGDNSASIASNSHTFGRITTEQYGSSPRGWCGAW